MSDSMTDPTNLTAAPLLPEREQEIRQGQPGDWLPGPWTIRDVEGTSDEPGRWELVHHESGTVLATLPDWAGNLALWAADAHDAVPELLAEVTRLRAELNQAHDDLTGACLARWEEEQDNARLRLALASAQRGRRKARNRTKGEGPDREAES